MNEVIKTLVKIADQLDLKGRSDLVAKVDETIISLAARPKSSKPLKKMEEKTKTQLFKFLDTACKNTEEASDAIEELMRRLRYFGVDGDVKSLKLDATLKDAKELYHLLEASKHKLHELIFGRKVPKTKKEQKAEDPFTFARFTDPGQIENLPKRHDYHNEQADEMEKDVPTKEEMDEFWGGEASPESFEADADDGETKLEQAKRIIENAQKSLGSDLGGFSALDLLADNVDWNASLDELKSILVQLGYDKYKKQKDVLNKNKDSKEVILYIFDDKIATMEDGSQKPSEYVDDAVKIGSKAFWVSLDDANTGYKINEAGYFGPYKTYEDAKNSATKEAEKLGLKVVSYEESNYGKRNG